MPELPALRDDLAILLDAVREAGEAVLPYFGADTPVRYKKADQPVTEADLAADGILHQRLLDSRPQYGWLSEESVASPDRMVRPRVWVVDPIDGTNSFVEGRPEFVVSVGLVEHGAPVAAALFNPVTGELYHALRGEGAFRDGTRISVAAAPAAGSLPVLLASRAEIGLGRFDPYRQAWELRPLGSTAYRMLKVADGSAHAFFSRSRKSEWDVCAATLVVEEAGGTVTQLGGEPLRFNQPTPAFSGIVVRGAVELALHDATPLP